ncbi:ABC transporter substrate-binding protein [Desulfosediminicola sp.]|uniref:ABC transporter substrate-binding protein n=1 Tax=Desulfosediminicola sp. TaxID=2886825 RepID=UPI003AF28B48
MRQASTPEPVCLIVSAGLWSIAGRWTILVLVLCILAGGCRDETPIKVGFIAGTSGKVADLGISGRDAVQMLVEEYNRNGGINGQRLDLVIKDDQQEPEIARKSVQELIDEGVVAIIGPMTSDMAMAITPVLDKHQIPAVSPTATTQHLSGQIDYFYRVSSTTREYATKSAAYHIRATEIRKIAVVFDKDNSSFTENWLNIFKQYFVSNGGEIVAEIGFEKQQKRSFIEIALELLSHEADGILIIANSMDSALFCQHIRKVDTDIPISLSDWGATERLLELGGRAIEGTLVVQTFDRMYSGEKYQAFRKEYFNTFKREPGFPGVYAYDAAQVVFTALEKQKKNHSLKETLDSIGQFPGLQGDIRFDEFGDVQRSKANISVVRNRKFIVLD